MALTTACSDSPSKLKVTSPTSPGSGRARLAASRLMNTPVPGSIWRSEGASIAGRSSSPPPSAAATGTISVATGGGAAGRGDAAQPASNTSSRLAANACRPRRGARPGIPVTRPGRASRRFGVTRALLRSRRGASVAFLVGARGFLAHLPAPFLDAPADHLGPGFRGHFLGLRFGLGLAGLALELGLSVPGLARLGLGPGLPAKRRGRLAALAVEHAQFHFGAAGGPFEDRAARLELRQLPGRQVALEAG